MGMVHYLTYSKLPNVKVVALCDKLPHRLEGDWRDIKGNFGPTGVKVDTQQIRRYNQIEDMLEDSGIDLLDITLPPSFHGQVATSALRSGMHVFCEKPMALDVEECSRMLEAAEEHNKRLFVGHVLPFFPEYAWAIQVVQSGEYGKLLGGAFKRVISDPNWLTDYWVEQLVGGPMLDLHVHDAHFVRLLFGMPSSVNTVGRSRKGVAEFWSTQFSFENQLAPVTATSGTISQQGRSFLHGFEILLERATLAFEFSVTIDGPAYLCRPVVFTEDGSLQHPALGSGDPMDAFSKELQKVIDCIESGENIAALNPELASDAVALCQNQSESLSRNCSIQI